MSEFYSRAVTVADMPFIMGEFEDGARKGHFYEEILTSKGCKTFEKQTKAGNQDERAGSILGAFYLHPAAPF